MPSAAVHIQTQKTGWKRNSLDKGGKLAGTTVATMAAPKSNQNTLNYYTQETYNTNNTVSAQNVFLQKVEQRMQPPLKSTGIVIFESSHLRPFRHTHATEINDGRFSVGSVLGPSSGP